MPLALVDKS